MKKNKHVFPGTFGVHAPNKVPAKKQNQVKLDINFGILHG
jgi:hypothetical protein